MSIESNKAVARRFVQDVMVHLDEAAADQVIAEDFTSNTWKSVPSGREALKTAMQRIGAGLSDVRMDVEDVIAEGDQVVIRLVASATHKGDFMGMPTTGKSYRIGEIHIVRIKNDQVVEHWHQADMLGLMQQLGAGERNGGTA
ncbi:MAG: ester cyclase [Candidatus Limnocylindrales bacterium]